MSFCIFSLEIAPMLFILLFFFRYTRLLVGLLTVWTYEAHKPQNSPTPSTEDVTVIVPTVDPAGVQFEECIKSIVAAGPSKIIVVTAGNGRCGRTNLEILERDWKAHAAIQLMECEVMNKRKQICKALPVVTTPITIFCDDHVFWPCDFLSHILAPFSDPTIGIVGTAKRVRRTIRSFSLAAFCNVLGCIYLEQHNFDLRATSAIDGGCFVISSRTVALRTEIVSTPAFMHEYTNEYTFFGSVGPLNADDDNFVTRWMINNGWRLSYQDTPGAYIETTIGDEGGLTKFLAQNLRWMRTRWRSNTTALFRDRTVWTVQPWCVYAVYITSFVNFALFYDASLIYTLWMTLDQMGTSLTRGYMLVLLLWIFCSKVVKTAGYWRRNPHDLVYLPGCILFGYFHSLIKLYSLITFWKTGWGSRNLTNENLSFESMNNSTWEESVDLALMEKQSAFIASVNPKGGFTDSGYASAEEAD